MSKNLDLDKIFDKYSINKVKKYDDEYNFSCPFPDHSDNSPSSYLNVDSLKYYCHGCGRKGNLASLIAELEGVPYTTAAKWIKTESDYLTASTESMSDIIRSAMKIDPRQNKVISDLFVDAFLVDWDKAYAYLKEGKLPRSPMSYMLEDRGFSPEILKEYKIGWDAISERITIPVRNSLGHLVGFKGRSLNDLPKYLAVGDKREQNKYGFKTYKKGDYCVFLDSIKSSTVIVCEGEFDALKLRQYGFGGSVSIGGSEPSKNQINELLKSAEEIVVFMDPDEAGKKATRKLVENLLQYVPVRVVEDAKADPADSTKKQAIQAITQAKSQIKQLGEQIENAKRI